MTAFAINGESAARNQHRRFVIVGASGSGKSHFAQKLSRALSIPYICNDAIIWRANWTPAPRHQRYDEFDRATQQAAWTYDGNIGSLRDCEDALILHRADTLIWLDLPKLDVMRQLLLRTIKRAWQRQPLWHGNIETWRGSFASRDSVLWWSWKTHALRQRQYRAIFADPKWNHLTKIRLRSRASADRWFSRVIKNASLRGAAKLARG